MNNSLPYAARKYTLFLVVFIPLNMSLHAQTLFEMVFLFETTTKK